MLPSSDKPYFLLALGEIRQWLLFHNWNRGVWPFVSGDRKG